MLGLRMPELLVIGFIVLLLFGPGKLAGLGQGLGESIRGFKKALEGKDEEPASKQVVDASASKASAATPSEKPGPGDGTRA
jgi:sec-independent protein translocase protein TatA